jgi:hypothetical protein
MGNICILYIDQILWIPLKPFTEKFNIVVYRQTVKSQSGSDVTHKYRLVTTQTVGCDITGVLLYTARGYNVGTFAEWTVRLCRGREVTCE